MAVDIIIMVLGSTWKKFSEYINRILMINMEQARSYSKV